VTQYITLKSDSESHTKRVSHSKPRSAIAPEIFYITTNCDADDKYELYFGIREA
jgi:hypothetical protein